MDGGKAGKTHIGRHGEVLDMLTHSVTWILVCAGFLKRAIVKWGVFEIRAPREGLYCAGQVLI